MVMLALFLCISPSLSLSYAEVHAVISESGRVRINYTLISKSGGNFSFYVLSPGSLLLEESCRMERERITCSLPENGRVVISELSESKKLSENLFSFEKNVRVLEDVENFVFLFMLPEGAMLAEGEKFMPVDGKIGTDGRRIFVIWSFKNVTAGEIKGVKIFYEFRKERAGAFPLAIALLPAAAGIALLLYFFRRRKMERMREIILPVLKDDERKIMEVILRYPKGVNQKVIVRETDYSKAKVSKVLASLAERGMIRIERVGRTNKVYLNENFRRE